MEHTIGSVPLLFRNFWHCTQLLDLHCFCAAPMALLITESKLALLFLVLSAQLKVALPILWKAKDFPDPQRNLNSCGRNGKQSYVCDPDGILTSREGTPFVEKTVLIGRAAGRRRSGATSWRYSWRAKSAIWAHSASRHTQIEHCHFTKQMHCLSLFPTYLNRFFFLKVTKWMMWWNYCGPQRDPAFVTMTVRRLGTIAVIKPLLPWSNECTSNPKARKWMS